MLFDFILAIYTCVVPFLQYGYSRTVSIESVDIPDGLIYHFDMTTSYNKDQPSNYTSTTGSDGPYYCKDSICVCMDDSIIKPFIELPNKNGDIHRYILIPYAGYFRDFTYDYNNESINVSTKCKTDEQCFSNKCVENTCRYNAESDVECCNDVYTKPTIFSQSKKDFYCGRMVGEHCVKNSDCSYKNCDGGRCSNIHYMPSDTDVITVGLQKLYLGTEIFIILIIIICCYCCFCFVKHHKKNNINFSNKISSLNYFE